jgi:hypothetical protein
MNELIGKDVHAALSHTGRVVLRGFDDTGSVRIDALDGVLERVDNGFATFRTSAVYVHPDDGITKPPDFRGLPGYVHEAIFIHPVKYIASISSLETR